MIVDWENSKLQAELRSEVRLLFRKLSLAVNALEVIRDNPRFNNGVEACHIAKECLELMERASRV